ncbi:MAG: hypothetical protein ACYC7E_18845 [Armatimonadota bacterium]
MNNRWYGRWALALSCLAVGCAVQAALVIKTDGTPLRGTLAPKQVITLVSGKRSRALPVQNITWLAGEKTRRIRLSKTTGPLLYGTIPSGALTLRMGTTTVKVPLAAVAFLYTGEVQPNVSGVEIKEYQQVHGATVKDIAEVRLYPRPPDNKEKHVYANFFVSNWLAGARIAQVRYPPTIAVAGTLKIACTVTSAHDAYANLRKAPVIGVIRSVLHSFDGPGETYAYAESSTFALPTAPGKPVATTIPFTSPFSDILGGTPPKEQHSFFLFLQKDICLPEENFESFAGGQCEALKTVSNILSCPVTVK